MNEKTLGEAIQKARDMADKLPEPYRAPAFEVVLRHLLGAEPAPRPPERPPGAGPTTPPAIGELNEFLAAKNPRSHPDRVVAIAYYFFRKNESGITTKDVIEAYGKARIKRPQNVHDVIATCVRRGLLVDTEKKDDMRAWVATPTGDAYVEAGFQEERS